MKGRWQRRKDSSAHGRSGWKCAEFGAGKWDALTFSMLVLCRKFLACCLCCFDFGWLAQKNTQKKMLVRLSPENAREVMTPGACVTFTPDNTGGSLTVGAPGFRSVKKIDLEKGIHAPIAPPGRLPDRACSLPDRACSLPDRACSLPHRACPLPNRRGCITRPPRLAAAPLKSSVHVSKLMHNDSDDIVSMFDLKHILQDSSVKQVKESALIPESIVVQRASCAILPAQAARTCNKLVSLESADGQWVTIRPPDVVNEARWMGCSGRKEGSVAYVLTADSQPAAAADFMRAIAYTTGSSALALARGEQFVPAAALQERAKRAACAAMTPEQRLAASSMAAIDAEEEARKTMRGEAAALVRLLRTRAFFATGDGMQLVKLRAEGGARVEVHALEQKLEAFCAPVLSGARVHLSLKEFDEYTKMLRVYESTRDLIECPSKRLAYAELPDNAEFLRAASTPGAIEALNVARRVAEAAAELEQRRQAGAVMRADSAARRAQEDARSKRLRCALARDHAMFAFEDSVAREQAPVAQLQQCVEKLQHSVQQQAIVDFGKQEREMATFERWAAGEFIEDESPQLYVLVYSLEIPVKHAPRVITACPQTFSCGSKQLVWAQPMLLTCDGAVVAEAHAPPQLVDAAGEWHVQLRSHSSSSEYGHAHGAYVHMLTRAQELLTAATARVALKTAALHEALEESSAAVARQKVAAAAAAVAAAPLAVFVVKYDVFVPGDGEARLVSEEPIPISFEDAKEPVFFYVAYTGVASYSLAGTEDWESVETGKIVNLGGSRRLLFIMAS